MSDSAGSRCTISGSVVVQWYLTISKMFKLFLGVQLFMAIGFHILTSDGVCVDKSNFSGLNNSSIYGWF